MTIIHPSFEDPVAALYSVPGVRLSRPVNLSIFLSRWLRRRKPAAESVGFQDVTLPFSAGQYQTFESTSVWVMGWIATVLGILIAVMFVYNWLNNKDVSPSISAEAVTGTQSVSSRRAHQASGKQQSEMLDKADLQAQPPTIVPTINTEEVQHVDETASEAEGRSKTSSSQSRSMPPPPSISTGTPTLGMMPPPPRSNSPPRMRPPTVGVAPRPGGSLRPPPSAASSLRVPVTKVLSNTSMAPSPSSSLMAPPKKVSKQVALEPGHSPLDWAALTTNPKSNLRGKDAPDTLVRITPSQLKMQNGRKNRDAWTVYQGKVYNITPYVPFHPGGKGEILRGAGKDSAKLFMEVHPWVNWDGMLSECCVGILVGEEEGKQNGVNDLDEMD